MKLGLIARADQSGLGVQTWEFAQHMRPEKTLVIDVSHLYNNQEECNKRLVFEYPRNSVQRVSGWEPSREQLEWLCEDVDAVYTAETTYGWELYNVAKRYGVRIFVAVNPEFCDHIINRRLPRPHMFLAPTMWMFEQIPSPKAYLPVPVATERFPSRPKNVPAKNFLHVVGRPAMEDRNGTRLLLSALQHVKSEINVTIRCMALNYVDDLMEDFPTQPDNVNLTVNDNAVYDYWNLYSGADVLIMPRRWGGMSLPIQEAFGAGMPVILGEHDTYAPKLPHGWWIESRRVGTFETRVSVEVYDVDPIDLAHKIDMFASNEVFADGSYSSADRLRDFYSWKQLKPFYDEVFEE